MRLLGKFVCRKSSTVPNGTYLRVNDRSIIHLDKSDSLYINDHTDIYESSEYKTFYYDTKTGDYALHGYYVNPKSCESVFDNIQIYKGTIENVASDHVYYDHIIMGSRFWYVSICQRYCIAYCRSCKKSKLVSPTEEYDNYVKATCGDACDGNILNTEESARLDLYTCIFICSNLRKTISNFLNELNPVK
jgi:hypothetical protein